MIKRRILYFLSSSTISRTSSLAVQLSFSFFLDYCNNCARARARGRAPARARACVCVVRPTVTYNGSDAISVVTIIINIYSSMEMAADSCKV